MRRRSRTRDASLRFLRAFQDRFVYEPGLFPPALPPRARITANASAVDIGRHAKELVKKPGKYCESDVVVVTGFSAEHLR
jgi:hypothetical protein